jgi:hypothetical protein
MSKSFSCIVCRAVASQVIQLQYCAQCQSTVYCSLACQKKDWKTQHKQICKLLNVGHGDMQLRTNEHMSLSIRLKEAFERGERSLDEDDKRFFKLFQESTFEGSQAAARKMTTFAKQQTKHNQKFLLFQSMHFLIRSDLEMLSWPNSPLLVMLQFVDPNMLSGDENASVPPLHLLAHLADPFDYSTHENQLILAKQLIEHGANVNAVMFHDGITPLHDSCRAETVTNLDLVEYLLENGADANSQDHLGMTPLMSTVPDAPGVAKFLLNWPTTDVDITTPSGELSFLAFVRVAVEYISDKDALPDNPDRVQHEFVLRQWRAIEEILVERGATDTGITSLE